LNSYNFINFVRMKKADTVKEITKYAKLLTLEQQEALLEQLRLVQLLDTAKKIDAANSNHQKKRKSVPPTMKEIVSIVHKVRSESNKKHAA
jgi:hypothetical protein